MCSMHEIPTGSPRIDTIMRMERTHEEIRRSMFDREELIAGQLQIIDMGDYGRHGVPNLTSRLFSSLKLAAEISQITDANYPETWRACTAYLQTMFRGV